MAYLPDSPRVHGTIAPPLIGRARERQALYDALDAALAGRGGLVLLSGDAGIGKTALAESLCDEAKERGARVLVGRCDDLAVTPPYGPWVRLFPRVAREREDASLSPPAVFIGGDGDGVGAVTSQAALFDAVYAFVVAAAAQRPLVLLLNDLHWADAASLDLLRFLARTLTDLPVLLIATYRAGELPRDHPLQRLIPALVREAGATRIALHPLVDTEVSALVTARYPLSAPDAERLVGYIQERAGGNPFFLGELLRTLEDDGALAHIAADSWALGPLDAVRVPALLRQVIEGRLERVENETRLLLAVAAVIGQEVPYALWAATAATDEETLPDRAAPALEAALLDELPDGTRVRFRHALIRAVLYETVLPSRRRRLHRQVAEQLAARPHADPDAVAYHFARAGDAQAARWLARAGERAERAVALLTATERYEAALALLDADGADPLLANPAERGWLLHGAARTRRYVTPRQSLLTLDAVDQLAGEADDAALAAIALRLRGLLNCYVGAVQRGLPEMAAAVAAIRALSPADTARLKARLDGTGFGAGDGYGTYVSWLALTGQNAEARERGERLVREMTAPQPSRRDPGDVIAYSGLAQVCAALGLPAQAREAFDQYRAANRALGDYAQVHSAWGYEAMFVYLPYAADYRDERLLLEDETERARAVAHGTALYPPRYMLQALLFVEGAWDEIEAITGVVRAAGITATPHQGWACVLGPLARARGDTERAWATVRGVFPDGPETEPGTLNFLDVLPVILLAADLARDAGDLPTARQWLTQYDRWLAWSGTVLGQAEGALCWAAYHRAAGNASQAWEAAHRALAHATTPRQPLALFATHRCLGVLATDAGQHADAAAHLDTALALADACAAPYERALTLLARAALGRATGDDALTTASLDEARAICMTLGATPALAQADALAVHMPVAVSPAADSTAVITTTTTTVRSLPGGLTAREMDVLRAIAGGQSNRGIADVLSISVRTVDRHISNAYAKIGVAGRAEAIAYAIRHHLTHDE